MKAARLITIPWAKFKKQLEPIEEGAWGVIISMARDSGEMQEVRIGPLRWAVAPSGMIIPLGDKQ